MDNTKFTKGKWKTYTYTSENGGETTIVQNLDYKGDRTDIHVRFSSIQETEKETNKANALLISKAPEMLEMLIKLCNLSPRNTIQVAGLMDKAEKLIKEATVLTEANKFLKENEQKS
jgi:hypothetical protein